MALLVLQYQISMLTNPIEELAGEVRDHLVKRYGLEASYASNLCTVESYKNDVSLTASLDSIASPMGLEEQSRLVALRSAYKWAYKVKRPCSESQNEEAIDQFRARSDAARAWRLRVDVRKSWPDEKLGRVFRLAQQLICHACARYEVGSPCHGPGTSFFRVKNAYEKYAYLERDVPGRVYKRFSDFFKPSPQSDTIPPFDLNDGRCRLSSVPKDVRGPRLVAPHNASAVWVQQAILDGIERTVLTHPIFRSYWPGEDDVQSVQLRDQGVNQRLAKYASLTTMYATLDLKDASDLVSWRLVCFLFRNTRLLRDLNAVRARTIVLPTGECVPCGMHAPMGSAVCFPIMALTLWALGTATMYVMDHDRPHYRPCSKELWVMAKPFVFGDDVIIETRFYNAVKTVFEIAGLKLNNHKCFFGEGGFRESCGHDYYRGYLITPVILRRDDITTVRGFASAITLYARLEKAGLGVVAEALLRILVDHNWFTKGGASHLAFVADSNSPGILIGESPYDTMTAIKLNRKIGANVRYNPRIQRYQVLLEHEVPDRIIGVSPYTDSRARLYEALAVQQRREALLDGKEQDVSFGWVKDHTRVHSSWVLI